MKTKVEKTKIGGNEVEFYFQIDQSGKKRLYKTTEYYDKKVVETDYYIGKRKERGGTDKSFSYVCDYSEKEYFVDEISNEQELLHHGFKKNYRIGNLNECGKNFPNEEVLFLDHKGSFKEGYLFGEYYQYYPNNQIFKHYNYDGDYPGNSTLHGICKQFYPNGREKVICNYNYGEENGIIKEYYNRRKRKKLSRIKFNGEFKEGTPIGEHKYYGENGNVLKKFIFIDGYNNYSKIMYHEDSNDIKSSESYIGGEKGIPTKRVGPEDWGYLDMSKSYFICRGT